MCVPCVCVCVCVCKAQWPPALALFFHIGHPSPVRHAPCLTRPAPAFPPPRSPSGHHAQGRRLLDTARLRLRGDHCGPHTSPRVALTVRADAPRAVTAPPPPSATLVLVVERVAAGLNVTALAAAALAVALLALALLAVAPALARAVGAVGRGADGAAKRR